VLLFGQLFLLPPQYITVDLVFLLRRQFGDAATAYILFVDLEYYHLGCYRFRVLGESHLHRVGGSLLETFIVKGNSPGTDIHGGLGFSIELEDDRIFLGWIDPKRSARFRRHLEQFLAAKLVFTFFILYYSIAAMNMAKFKEAILGEEQASIGLLELLNSAEIIESIQSLTGLKSDDIVSDITELVESQEMDVDTSRAKIVVRIPGLSLFPPASADLQLEGRPLLDEVIRIVKKYPNYKIHIQGHTDDEPIFTDRFPTNWELSAARATAVLRYFIDKGVNPKKLTATGYADTFPLTRNDTAMGRAKNRRVEFVLEKEKS